MGVRATVSCHACRPRNSSADIAEAFCEAGACTGFVRQPRVEKRPAPTRKAATSAIRISAVVAFYLSCMHAPSGTKKAIPNSNTLREGEVDGCAYYSDRRGGQGYNRTAKRANSLHRSHFAAIENLKSRAASGIVCSHTIIVKPNLQGLVSWPSSDRQARALVSRGRSAENPRGGQDGAARRVRQRVLRGQRPLLLFTQPVALRF